MLIYGRIYSVHIGMASTLYCRKTKAQCIVIIINSIKVNYGCENEGQDENRHGKYQ